MFREPAELELGHGLLLGRTAAHGDRKEQGRSEGEVPGTLCVWARNNTFSTRTGSSRTRGEDQEEERTGPGEKRSGLGEGQQRQRRQRPSQPLQEPSGRRELSDLDDNKRTTRRLPLPLGALSSTDVIRRVLVSSCSLPLCGSPAYPSTSVPRHRSTSLIHHGQARHAPPPARVALRSEAPQAHPPM